MSRDVSEVTQEVLAAGWSFDGQDDYALAGWLAERLDDGEQIVDALRGRVMLRADGVTRSFDRTAVNWLIVTQKRVLIAGVDKGGWFSGPSVSGGYELHFSDILEASLKFISHDEWGGKASGVTVKTPTTVNYRNVPVNWASEERVRQFVDALRARCSGIATSLGAAPKRSFADEVQLLRDLRARELLTDEEVAQAIRKLMAQ